MLDYDVLVDLLRLQGRCEVLWDVPPATDVQPQEACLQNAMRWAIGAASEVLMQFLLDDSWTYVVRITAEWRHLDDEHLVAVVILEAHDAEPRPLSRETLAAVAEAVRLLPLEEDFYG